MRTKRRTFPPSVAIAALAVASFLSGCAPGQRVVAFRDSAIGNEAELPPVQREFRGLWVATVANSDWPSRPGLTADEQKTELREVLDRAVQLHLNAIILQVRPACDAIYPSAFDPWSEFLTGQQGKSPGYDPLEFAVTEAHRRGLELHAWFNPYRASHPSEKSGFAPAHITQRRPNLVRRYGKYLWLDPAEPAVQTFVLGAIQDVVRRYDVDGVHLDDYFYPYPERGANGKVIDFPDDDAWLRYRAGGGSLSRSDWRRSNVNAFVARLYEIVKSDKPWVKVGISPFGIWRPGFPRTVKGLDAYNELYADARLWLAQGWVDYLAPQLYWRISAPAQSYPLLLQWWLSQNSYRRYVWPGLFASQVGGPQNWRPEEIARQIDTARRMSAGGNVLFSAKAVTQADAGLAGLLRERVYPAVALPPALPWIDHAPPAAPRARLEKLSGGARRLTWQEGSSERAAKWVVRIHGPYGWLSAVVGGDVRAMRFGRQDALDFIAINAVDRVNNVGPPAVIGTQ